MYEKPSSQESNEDFGVGDEIVLTEEVELVEGRDGLPAQGAFSVEEADQHIIAGTNIISGKYPKGTRGVITMLPEHEGTVHVRLEGRESSIAIPKRKIKLSE
mgnify:CR=1 FL=1